VDGEEAGSKVQKYRGRSGEDQLPKSSKQRDVCSPNLSRDECTWPFMLEDRSDGCVERESHGDDAPRYLVDKRTRASEEERYITSSRSRSTRRARCRLILRDASNSVRRQTHLHAEISHWFHHRWSKECRPISDKSARMQNLTPQWPI